MVRFYDPMDKKELGRIEELLTAAGIEFSVMPEQSGSKLPGSIRIAEEDLPRAEELFDTLPKSSMRH